MSLASESAPVHRAAAEPSMAGVGDYVALLKPRVMSLVVFTALVGIVVAPGHLHPVLAVFGVFETRRQIPLYSLVLAPVGASPWLLGYAGWLYAAVSLASGALMVGLALRLWRAPSEPAAKRLFAFSIVYLVMLFATLLSEHALGLSAGRVPA